jgi:hypothetical protein
MKAEGLDDCSRCRDEDAFVIVETVRERGGWQSVSGVFRERIGASFTLSVRTRLAPSTAIGVAYQDVYFIGTVLACGADSPDSWLIEVQPFESVYFKC